MGDSEQCELHQVAVFGGSEDAEALLQLSRSPIGDECQVCPVCRSAREFIAVRLAEQRGQIFSPSENSEVALKKLQGAIEATKAHVRRHA